jgi:hypothetical protein
MDSEMKKIWYVVAAIIVIIGGTLFYVHAQEKTMLSPRTQSNVLSSVSPSGFPIGLVPSSASGVQYFENLQAEGVAFKMNEVLPNAAEDYMSDIQRIGWTGVMQPLYSTSSAAIFISNATTKMSGEANMLLLPGGYTGVTVTIKQ